MGTCEYQPTTLFSLRPATATTSGGKSLIVPTPFAVKMALLDVAIRTQGAAAGSGMFPALRSLRIALCLPERDRCEQHFHQDPSSEGSQECRE